MELIEVNIKLASNNHVYNLPIRKSETINKLKEYCQVISNIPQDQQILLYKGKNLSNEKLIKDYDIENNNDIILTKKEEQKTVQNSGNSNFNIIDEVKKFTDNKQINADEVFKSLEQNPDIFSYLEKIDYNKLNNFYKMMGVEKFLNISGEGLQELNEILKDPSQMNYIKNTFKDPSLFKAHFNSPKFQNYIQNNPFLKLLFQNPKIFFAPDKIQMSRNIINKNDRNAIEDSSTEISEPPDPFESLNNNQSNQILNSSGQISNINILNKNSTVNKEIFGNNGIDIDYKKEYKDQLSQLEDMGFINEEKNIQALKMSKGNFNNAIEILLKNN